VENNKIITLAKCSLCGKIFKVPLTPDAARALEKSKELSFICSNCAVKEIYKNNRVFKPIK
jgi:DNA-directed RNA polymerase subunit RPC12/RpoP